MGHDNSQMQSAVTVFNDRNYSTDAIMEQGHLNKSSTAMANVQKNYAHDHMLLNKAHQTNPQRLKDVQALMAPQRTTMNLNEILAANNSSLQTNASSSSIIDTGRILKPKRSLNFLTKKQEAERIDEENEKIM